MKNLSELLFDIQERLKEIRFYDEIETKKNREENCLETKDTTI